MCSQEYNSKIIFIMCLKKLKRENRNEHFTKTSILVMFWKYSGTKMTLNALIDITNDIKLHYDK